ncbi:lycopene cyclase family protein [Jiulongibacter sp. NS-SX5]|uniref:lycopene cyclase family protein n=1 Tax=Jiulongibacter sp. NS-SX5 TaxID=3463854 RepID=UPI00405A1CCD
MTESFDYAIIGAGAAGLQLALAMADDAFFESKTILILDPDDKSQNDKTWCFWEKGAGQFDGIIHQQWGQTVFADQHGETKLSAAPYQYKMLRSIDFYRFAKRQLEPKSNFHWYKKKVLSLEEKKGSVTISTEQGEYQVSHCFDSRVPQEFSSQPSGYHYVLQHFKGQILKFDRAVFNLEEFVMMDYRLTYLGQTTFMYILPISESEALLEYTFFTNEMVETEVYERFIAEYVKAYIKADYSITEEEQGVIPMSSFPFHHYHTNRITKIGTGGGWVRASTGYSFRNAGKLSRQLVSNIKNGQKPEQGLFKPKYYFYDRLMLNVLRYENTIGPKFFAQIYRNNPLDRVFRFLDGESSLLDDLGVITSVSPMPFIRAVFRELKLLFQ